MKERIEILTKIIAAISLLLIAYTYYQNSQRHFTSYPRYQFTNGDNPKVFDNVTGKIIYYSTTEGYYYYDTTGTEQYFDELPK